jgi:hypothetical protein
MPTNLTDEQLIARAEAAGWVWVENVTGKWYSHGDTKPVTGWECGNGHSFISAKPNEKAKALRADAGKGNNFEHPHDCHFCGQPMYLGYLDNARLVGLKECFDCNHWLGLHRGGRSIVIARDGGRSHYQAGKAKTPGPHNGFGGDRFKIKFTDGRVEDCCDLWHQGTIPERFYDLLPVNAEFVRDAK